MAADSIKGRVHKVAEDLEGTCVVGDWQAVAVASVIAGAERLLACHAAFLAYLEETGRL